MDWNTAEQEAGTVRNCLCSQALSWFKDKNVFKIMSGHSVSTTDDLQTYMLVYNITP